MPPGSPAPRPRSSASDDASEPWDVLVVGAGPGGLASALLLAGLGLRVHVVERADVPGGRMGRVGDGTYTLDTGPTILQLPQVLEGIFRSAGLSLGDFVSLAKVEPNTRIHFWDGSRVDTFDDAEKNRRAWEGLMPGGAARFDAFFREHEAKYRVAYDAFIAHDASSVLDYYNPLRLLPAMRFAPWESLATNLGRTVKDPRLVYALSYPSKYLGLHPTTCSSVFSVVAFLELAFGVFHPRGGFRALADGMAAAIAERGGSISYGVDVERVLVERGRAVGVVVRQGGTTRTIRANHVVVNADWAAAKSRLVAPADRPRTPDAALERKRYSCSTFMLYLGLDRVYDSVPHHSILLSEAARRTDRAALEDRDVDPEGAPFYVCNPSVTDPTGAPPGHSTLYVLVPCPNTSHAVDWKSVAPRMADTIVRRLGRVGFEDLGRHVRMRRIAHAETWRDDFRVFRGAVFNLAHDMLQLGPLRPRVDDDDVDHLHWVGGGTHPGSGLLTIFESANLAAASIARAHGIAFDRPKAPPIPRSAFQPPRTDSRLDGEALHHLL
ncbi:MAG: phytoene desaturase family protein [Polyangiaceae bacterium]